MNKISSFKYISFFAIFFVYSCTSKNSSDIAQTPADSSEVKTETPAQEPLPLNPSRSAWNDFTFDVAIRNDGNTDILIMIMRKGAFMNQITKNIDSGNTVKGSGSFDTNGNNKPELITCYGNSSSSGINIAEVDEIGNFSPVEVKGTLPVLPEVINVVQKDNEILLTNTDETVISTLQKVENNGTLGFIIK